MGLCYGCSVAVYIVVHDQWALRVNYWYLLYIEAYDGIKKTVYLYLCDRTAIHTHVLILVVEHLTFDFDSIIQFLSEETASWKAETIHAGT